MCVCASCKKDNNRFRCETSSNRTKDFQVLSIVCARSLLTIFIVWAKKNASSHFVRLPTSLSKISCVLFFFHVWTFVWLCVGMCVHFYMMMEIFINIFPRIGSDRMVAVWFFGLVFFSFVFHNNGFNSRLFARFIVFLSRFFFSLQYLLNELVGKVRHRFRQKVFLFNSAFECDREWGKHNWWTIRRKSHHIDHKFNNEFHIRPVIPISQIIFRMKRFERRKKNRTPPTKWIDDGEKNICDS